MFMDECNLPMPRVDQLQGDPLTLSSTFQQSIATAALPVERTVAAAINLLLDAQHRPVVASEHALVNR
jgi:hypothetical protein